MATTRIKDVSKTTTDLASDEYIIADGATNGTQKMARDDAYADWAAAYVAAPTTYKLAPLNSGTNKIDGTYLPTSADTAKGEWNANTNTPTLADGAGTAGDYYDVTTAGTVDLGSGSIAYTVGDVVKYNGTTWYKIDSVANVLDGSATAADGRTTLEVDSSDEVAESTGTKLVGPSLYFDGVDDYLEFADDAKFSFTDGTDDLPFTIEGWVKVDSIGATQPIVTKYGASSAVREWSLYVDSNGKLSLLVTDTSGNAAKLVSDTVLAANTLYHVAASYAGAGPNSSSAFTANMSGGNAALYINAVVESSPVATDNASFAGMSDTTQPVWLGRISSTYLSGHIKDVKIFNRELTAAEVEDVYRHGQLGFADEWGGANYVSDFTSTTDGWTASGVTLTANYDSGDAGYANTLRIVAADGSSDRANYAYSFTVGKRYRLSLNYKQIVGSQGRISAAGIALVPTIAAGAWTNYSGEFVATATDPVRAYAANSGGSAADEILIQDVRVEDIGTLADFRAERYDSSTDKLYDLANDFIGTNNGASLVGREIPVYESSGTWTPTITFGGGSTGMTYTSQEGYYTRIGNTVFATGGFILSAKGSSTGAAIVALPSTARNTTDDIQGASVGRGLNMANLTSAVSGYIVDNTTSLKLMDWGATGAVDLDESNFTDTTELNLSVTYQIS